MKEEIHRIKAGQFVQPVLLGLFVGIFSMCFCNRNSVLLKVFLR